MATAGQASVTSDLRAVFRWLYTNNPFYALSAALTFAGLRMSFDTGGSSFQTNALLIALVAYTLVLAGSAWFLIRHGSLWEDVRTLLLVIVLMLVAISVSFDDTLATNLQTGIPLFLGGLLFASGLSEGLLHAIRLRLAIGYRLPYHGILAVFFLYPVLLSQWIRDPQSPTLYWGLFGFSAMAGGVFLVLLPAIRRGPAYANDNGSPWAWPWYPLLGFAMLGFGVCVRAYYLCVSFHFVGVPQTIFAPYFLVPFFWSVAILLLELGLVSRNKWRVHLALTVAVVVVMLAVTASPDHASDLGFLKLFHGTLGASPLFLTLVAVGSFYLVAWFRGVSEAFLPFALTLSAFSICGPATFNPSTLAPASGLPLLGTGAVFLFVGTRSRHAFACLIGGWCAVLGLWIDLRDHLPTDYHLATLAHAMLAITLAVGLLFHNVFGMWIQRLGAASLLGFALISLACEPESLGSPPPLLLAVYPLLAGCVAAAYGCLANNQLFHASAAACLGGWLVVNGWSSYRFARRAVVGLDYIVAGVAFFVVAMLVSLSKTGLLRRFLQFRGARK